MALPRRSKTFTPDNPTAHFLYTILKQLDLKLVDWNEVAFSLDITNGHAARMRYARFKQQIEGLSTQLRAPRAKKNERETCKAKGKRRKADDHGKENATMDVMNSHNQYEPDSQKKVKIDMETTPRFLSHALSLGSQVKAEPMLSTGSVSIGMKQEQRENYDDELLAAKPSNSIHPPMHHPLASQTYYQSAPSQYFATSSPFSQPAAPMASNTHSPFSSSSGTGSVYAPHPLYPQPPNIPTHSTQHFRSGFQVPLQTSQWMNNNDNDNSRYITNYTQSTNGSLPIQQRHTVTGINQSSYPSTLHTQPVTTSRPSSLPPTQNQASNSPTPISNPTNTETESQNDLNQTQAVQMHQVETPTPIKSTMTDNTQSVAITPPFPLDNQPSTSSASANTIPENAGTVADPGTDAETIVIKAEST